MKIINVIEVLGSGKDRRLDKQISNFPTSHFLTSLFLSNKESKYTMGFNTQSSNFENSMKGFQKQVTLSVNTMPQIAPSDKSIP